VLNVDEIYFHFYTQVFFEYFRLTIGMDSLSVLIFLPEYDFDPTEVVVSWKCLTSYGINVFFTTEKANESTCDMIQMKKGGVVFGILSASDDIKRTYKDMCKSNNFKKPILWNEVNVENFHGIILPGGHATGVKPYLESEVVREKVIQFWKLKRPIGAMSRAVLILARAKKQKNNLSIIRRRSTTTFPKLFEDTAYYLTRLSHGNLFKPYEKSCEEEVCESLEEPNIQYRKSSINPKMAKKDTLFDQSNGFVVVDKQYISSRWAGDSYTFIFKFIELLTGKVAQSSDPQVNENNQDLKEDKQEEIKEETVSLV